MKRVTTVLVLIVLFVIVAVSFSESEPVSLEVDCMNIVQLSFYAFNEGDWASFSDLHSPSYLQYSPDSDVPIAWAEYLSTSRIVHERYPALQLRVIDIFACLDKVAVRYVWEYPRDSHIFRSHYPNGVAQGSAIGIFRIENSKIIEEWCEYDPADIRLLVNIVRLIDLAK